MENKSYRILLCDDDPDEALFLETAFLKAGFQVDLEWFDRCSTLLNNLPERTEIPDLIFVDLNMPGENGLECLALIKKLPPYKHVPVIIYTTSVLSTNVTDAFKHGASLYLPKTASETEMIEVVKYLAAVGREELQRPRLERFCYYPKKPGR